MLIQIYIHVYIMSNININIFILTMEHPISQRIKILIKRESEGKIVSFASKLDGIPYQSISRLFKKDERSGKYPTPSTDILIEIINKYINYSAEWLLTGEGEMIKAQESSITVGKNLTTEELLEKSDAEYWKDEYIAVQKKYTALLENKLQEVFTVDKSSKAG